MIKTTTVSLLFFIAAITTRAQTDSIDLFINNQLKQQGIVGLSLGIVKNGKIIKAKGYGYANLELKTPASERTVYKIASVSKQFVAAGIMKLVQEGTLNVSDPITKFIKDAPANWNAITIHHLLNHTSGLPADPPGFDWMKEQADAVYIRAAFKERLTFPPGSNFEYSNFGYFILADIIRITSRLSFADYMQKHIFDTCGLKSTRTTSVSSVVPNRADGYLKDSLGLITNAPNVIAMRPSGAFLSTVDDLLKWEMVMQHHELLTQKTWNQLWEHPIKTPLTMDGEVIYYGYGWMINQLSGKQLVHHGGSLPGFKSVYFRFVKEKTAIVIVTNSDTADMYGIAFGIIDILSGK